MRLTRIMLISKSAPSRLPLLLSRPIILDRPTYPSSQIGLQVRPVHFWHTVVRFVTPDKSWFICLTAVEPLIHRAWLLLLWQIGYQTFDLSLDFHWSLTAINTTLGYGAAVQSHQLTEHIVLELENNPCHIFSVPGHLQKAVLLLLWRPLSNGLIVKVFDRPSILPIIYMHLIV